MTQLKPIFSAPFQSSPYIRNVSLSNLHPKKEGAPTHRLNAIRSLVELPNITSGNKD
jgi:hypothetical protein